LVQPPPDLEKFASLLTIVEALRSPDGCPWDKEQTHRTLTPFAIEEAHELAEAIEAGDEKEMISELGDLLLQVVLHAEIGRQEGRFDISDVIRAISEKMVRRHPHVFSDARAADSAEVLANWPKLKEQEKAARNASNASASSPTDLAPPMRFDITLSLPALIRSQKIGDKTKHLRFDWNNTREVMSKVEEELEEVRAELAKIDAIKSTGTETGTETKTELGGGSDKGASKAALEHEIGDLLFSVTQLARHAGLEAEQCLRTANARFEQRFFTMRRQIAASGRNYDQLSMPELEEAWQVAKESLQPKAL